MAVGVSVLGLVWAVEGFKFSEPKLVSGFRIEKPLESTVAWEFEAFGALGFRGFGAIRLSVFGLGRLLGSRI